MAVSRKDVLKTHAGGPEKLRRCPICRWLIDVDHEEALAMTRQGTINEAVEDADLVCEETGFAFAG